MNKITSILVILLCSATLYFYSNSSVSTAGPSPLSFPAQNRILEREEKNTKSEVVSSDEGRAKAECLAFLSTHQSSEFLKAKMKAETAKWFMTLNEASRTPERLGYIAEMSGLEWEEGAMYSGQYMLDEQPSILKSSASTSQIPMNAAAKILKSIRSGKYQQLARWVESGDIPKGSIFDRSILETVIELDEGIMPAEIGLLRSAGLTVGAGELMLATANGFSPEQMWALYRGSGIEPGIVWKFHGRNQSFVTVAVEHFDQALTAWWIARGAAVYSENKDINAIEFLKKPSGKEQISAAVTIYHLLVSNGVKSISTSSLRRINAWLPEGIAERPLLVQSEFVNEDLVGTIQSIKSAMSRTKEEFDTVWKVEHQCATKHLILRETVDSLADDLFVRRSKSNLSSRPTRDQNRKTYLDKLQEMANAVDDKTMQSISNVVMASYGSTWDEALASAESLSADLDDDASAIYTALLMQALMRSAPFEYVEKLLTMGARLEPATIIVLSLKSSSVLARKLLPYGLELDYVDQYGQNALSYAVMNPQSDEMFQFLLEHNVSVSVPSEGMDPLNLALSNVRKFPLALEFVQSLIDNGAKINNSHRQQLELLSIEDQQLYQAVISRAPSLAL